MYNRKTFSWTENVNVQNNERKSKKKKQKTLSNATKERTMLQQMEQTHTQHVKCSLAIVVASLLSYEFIMLVITYCCGYCLLLWCLNKITISRLLNSTHSLSLSYRTNGCGVIIALLCVESHSLPFSLSPYCLLARLYSVCPNDTFQS